MQPEGNRGHVVQYRTVLTCSRRRAVAKFANLYADRLNRGAFKLFVDEFRRCHKSLRGASTRVERGTDRQVQVSMHRSADAGGPVKDDHVDGLEPNKGERGNNKCRCKGKGKKYVAYRPGHGSHDNDIPNHFNPLANPVLDVSQWREAPGPVV